MLETLKRIAQTPAPSHFEHARADLIFELWQSLGYSPHKDSVGNVYVQLGSTESKALLLGAHLDTVFDAHIDHTVHEQAGRWVGAGVGDNSSSLAVLTEFLKQLDTSKLKKPLWVMANVGEEGLGDLKGAKHFLAEHHRQLAGFIAVDGYLGYMVHRTVGSKRYRVVFKTEGGHSWGDQNPSAIHALGLAIQKLYTIPLSIDPRTALNVGTVSGGTSVNSIAARAELVLDLRSTDAKKLEQLESRALAVCVEAARVVHAKVECIKVGDRPTGNLNNGALVHVIEKVALQQDIELRLVASSTDANAAAPYAVPAVALGVYSGGNAHRLDEWMMPNSLSKGLSLLQKVVEAWQES